METLKAPAGYNFGPIPDPEHPDYQAGYAIGQQNAKFGVMDDSKPLPSGWQFKPRGTSRQWSHGHTQALFDCGVSDWNLLAEHPGLRAKNDEFDPRS